MSPKKRTKKRHQTTIHSARQARPQPMLTSPSQPFAIMSPQVYAQLLNPAMPTGWKPQPRGPQVTIEVPEDWNTEPPYTVARLRKDLEFYPPEAQQAVLYGPDYCPVSSIDYDAADGDVWLYDPDYADEPHITVADAIEMLSGMPQHLVVNYSRGGAISAAPVYEDDGWGYPSVQALYNPFAFEDDTEDDR